MPKGILIVLTFFVILALLMLGTTTLLGWLAKVVLHLQHNYGWHIGCTLAVLTILIALWGVSIGFSRLETQHVTLVCEGLPKEFDGYRIIHITDAHLGSFIGHESLWTEAVDAMLVEKADLIVFTGDLQNNSPAEIEPFLYDMSRLRARDGVIAVLGNHDYGYPRTASSPKRVCEAEEKAGWRVLINEHIVIERNSASIIIGGMDNDGDGKHFPKRGDVAKTLKNTTPDDFVIMLEHDPTSWRRNILPHSNAQLTLSGHTHAMQFGIFGWSPSKWIYSEWCGMFTKNNRYLFVSSGIGGVVPFRFGMTREIVVIELRAKC